MADLKSLEDVWHECLDGCFRAAWEGYGQGLLCPSKSRLLVALGWSLAMWEKVILGLFGAASKILLQILWIEKSVVHGYAVYILSHSVTLCLEGERNCTEML